MLTTTPKRNPASKSSRSDAVLDRFGDHPLPAAMHKPGP
jgi:hypothetical protein